MEEVAFNPTIEPPELTQDWETDQDPGGDRQNFVRARTQEKEAVTPQETDPGLPVCVHQSPTEAWVSSGLLQGQRH